MTYSFLIMSATLRQISLLSRPLNSKITRRVYSWGLFFVSLRRWSVILMRKVSRSVKRHFTERGTTNNSLSLAVVSPACLSKNSDCSYRLAQLLYRDSDGVDSRCSQSSPPWIADCSSLRSSRSSAARPSRGGGSEHRHRNNRSRQCGLHK